MHDLSVRCSRGTYRVRFSSGFEGLAGGLASGEHLLVDARVADLHRQTLSSALARPSTLILRSDEAAKSLERMPSYITHLLKHGIRRGHVLVAVGGGVVQDITAFIASVLFRGIRWRFYPTTLLAQADSCIGSKSSLNVGRFKNQVGSFLPPDEVILSPEVLNTLPVAERRSGMGEIVKAHALGGEEDVKALCGAWHHLWTDPAVRIARIRRSLEIKRELIELDEFDRGPRRILNYGHSFGHALETATRFAIPHGVAVSMGMELANRFAVERGFISQATGSEIHPLLASIYGGFAGVPLSEKLFFQALSFDKKNGSQTWSFVLMRDRYRFSVEEFRKTPALRQGILRILREVVADACPDSHPAIHCGAEPADRMEVADRGSVRPEAGRPTPW